MRARPANPLAVWAATVLALAAAYWVTGRLGLFLAVPPGYASVVWPPSGVALAGVLLFGYRTWPGVWLGSALLTAGVYLASNPGASTSAVALGAGVGTGAALQALAGAFLVRRFVGFPHPLDSERSVLTFLALGGPVSCLIAATWGVSWLTLAGALPREDNLAHWWIWWVGDTTGAIVVAPLVVIWAAQPRRDCLRRALLISLPTAVLMAVVIALFLSSDAGLREHLSWGLLAAGLMVTGFLAAFLLVMTGRAATVKRLADELARANRELQQEITERRRAEEERQLLEARVRQAQKLESLGVLAGGIAHDFNNLLTGILGYAGLARGDLPPNSPAGDSIREIEKAVARAAELTQQLLAYSGKGRFLTQPLDLSELVREALPALASLVSRKAQVEIEPVSDGALVEADPAQVRQALTNLVVNAAEAMPEQGGVVRVRTGVRHVAQAELATLYPSDDLPEGDYAYLEVSDTGCGMSESTLGRIFDPFFTTKFPGRGLGLAAVLGIARGHRGAIRVTSVPGQGSTFQLLLPAAQRAAFSPPVPADRHVPTRGTVLVIEDEESIRAIARRVLEDAGFGVLTACDGAEGIELFRRCAAEVTAVLLDLTMPRMSGAEALVELRRLRPDVPVVLMSGYSQDDIAGRFGNAVPAAFLQKPFSPATLLSRLRGVLTAQ